MDSLCAPLQYYRRFIESPSNYIDKKIDYLTTQLRHSIMSHKLIPVAQSLLYNIIYKRPELTAFGFRSWVPKLCKVLWVWIVGSTNREEYCKGFPLKLANSEDEHYSQYK